MKREFHPVVTPLEGRGLMSAGLNGTLLAQGPSLLATPVETIHLLLFLHPGKLGKIKVAGGWGFLLSGDPSTHHGFDYINLETGVRQNSSYVSMTAITAPVAASSPSGPVTLNMQVRTATGVFAQDLGAIVSVRISIRSVLKRTMGLATLAISFSPA
jgi:hypothetical protein